jgi:methyl-accepting chemotaxis protein
MDTDYVLFIGSVIVVGTVFMLLMYLIYRRGIAIRLAAIIAGIIIIVASVCFVLGKEGISLARASIAAVLGTPLIVGLLMMMARQIITPVQQIARAAEGIARGDLNQHVEVKSKDELGDMAAAFQRMIANLNDILQQTNAVVEQVVPSVEQMRAISQSLASSAEEQSAAAEEVASSLEETDAQVKSNAESANVANQLVSQTSNVANDGQEKMKAMTKAMAAIAQSSQQISKIIKVIDEIAFQTNLLALNAAVEAARAGQHGRGFAVVAQEVRNLAGRSAKAARETAELIEDAGRRVEEGVGIADETATTLGDIVQNVLKVKDLVAEIAAASEDQARGVAQVNTAMVQVNQGAQAASQQSEELASTADELGHLAGVLREQTAQFRLREQQGHAPAITGLTPEMLRQVEEMVRSQSMAGVGAPEAAKLQGGKGDAKLELPLDRDERGYGEF